MSADFGQVSAYFDRESADISCQYQPVDGQRSATQLHELNYDDITDLHGLELAHYNELKRFLNPLERCLICLYAKIDLNPL